MGAESRGGFHTVILHIANIRNDLFVGVSSVVPQHVLAQNEFATVGFLNVNNTPIESLKEQSPKELDQPIQMPFETPFAPEGLPAPFSSPDLAVFHECYCPQYLPVAKALRRRGIPYVLCPHGELRREAQQKKWLKKKAANLLLFDRFIDGAAGLQFLSEAEKDGTRFGKHKFVATNGIQLPDRRKERFSEEGTRFLYIGRYEWRVKGLDLLFQAIRQQAEFLRSRHCSFDLYGPDVLGRLDQVRDLVRENGIEDLVSLHERISGREKEEALLAADIFLQTSRHEGMPMGILEAMGYGLPCMLTEGTSLGDAVKAAQGGWCAETEAESIGRALVQAVEERSRWKEYGRNAAAYVAQRHAWNRVASDTLEAYHRLLNEKN